MSTHSIETVNELLLNMPPVHINMPLPLETPVLWILVISGIIAFNPVLSRITIIFKSLGKSTKNSTPKPENVEIFRLVVFAVVVVAVTMGAIIIIAMFLIAA